jgi:hypothetical protein
VQSYGMTRSQGLNASGLYRGQGKGGRWAWDMGAGGALALPDADALAALLAHVAEEGLEPVCLVPDMRTPKRASMAILDSDEISMTEITEWQGPEALRYVSVELPFRGVIA